MVEAFAQMIEGLGLLGMGSIGTPLTVGQGNNAPVALHEMMPWLIALAVLSVVGVGAIVVLRRRLFASSEAPEAAGMMSELRAMRDRGDLTEDEYERTRAVMIARATGKDAREILADSIRKSGGLVAAPGFDLAGRPLPKPAGDRRAPDSGEDA